MRRVRLLTARSTVARATAVGLAVGLVAGLTACGSEASKSSPPSSSPSSTPSTFRTGNADVTLVKAGEPAAPPAPAVLRTTAAGERAFALSLYAQLAAGHSNVVLAPTSIATVLGMVAAGAQGATRTQLVAALRVALTDAQLHAGIGGLARTLATRATDGVVLSEVDQAWVQRGLKLLDAYTRTLTADYAAPLATIDFADHARAADAINAWVAEGTRGKITKLIEPAMLDNAALVLTDAVYLDATWEHGFDPKRTGDLPFHLAGGSTVDVPTMTQTGEFSVGRGAGYTAVALPYKGGALEMDVVVPDDLDQFARGLDASRLDAVLASMHPIETQLALPKFTFRSRFDTLKGALGALGVRDVFDPNLADLSGIDGGHDLYLSALVHEAYVRVDERGTVAAGATGGVVGITAAPSSRVQVDRPFLFVVRDTATGAVVFLGRVEDPRAG